MSPLTRFFLTVSTISWVAVGIWTVVVHGIMDPDHLWAPYMGVLLFGPFWAVGGWAAVRAVRLARGDRDRAAAGRWATRTAIFGWIASIPFLDAVARVASGDPFASINPEGIGLVGATALVTAAAIGIRRSARTADSVD